MYYSPAHSAISQYDQRQVSQHISSRSGWSSVAECLLSVCQVLGSLSSPAKQKASNHNMLSSDAVPSLVRESRDCVGNVWLQSWRSISQSVVLWLNQLCHKDIILPQGTIRNRFMMHLIFFFKSKEALFLTWKIHKYKRHDKLLF